MTESRRVLETVPQLERGGTQRIYVHDAQSFKKKINIINRTVKVSNGKTKNSTVLRRKGRKKVKK